MADRPCTIPGERRLRVSKVRVETLFGTLTHDVPLDPDARVTIVLGTNGVGKTQLFECVAGLFSGHLERLVAVPFSSLEISLSDATVLRVDQRTIELPPREAGQEEAGPRLRMGRANRVPRVHRRLTLQMFEADGTPLTEPWEPEDRNVRRRPTEAELPPWIEQVGFGHWLDTRRDRMLTTRELKALYGHHEAAFDKGPAWFARVLERTSVRLIETQRLLRTHAREPRLHSPERWADAPVRYAVSDIVDDFRERRQSARQRYFREQSRLDQTYVTRFLEYEAPDETLEAVQLRLADIDRRRVRLEQLSLIEAEGSAESAVRLHVSEEKRLALSLHAADMARKLATLEPLAKQLESLISMVNRRLAPSGKKVAASAEEGFAMLVDGAPHPLQLELLSSGEQHQLVLLYDLHFRVSSESLVLIDEPELSLHPIWQQEIVDDLVEIAKTNNFDIVLATHSPYVVGGRGASCVRLRHAGGDEVAP